MNEELTPVLQARGLAKRFAEGGLDVEVLTGVDLEVHPGETLAIVGASGSGKSTLLHLLGALDAPTAGTVTLMGRRLDQMGPAEQGEWRNQHLALGGRIEAPQHMQQGRLAGARAPHDRDPLAAAHFQVDAAQHRHRRRSLVGLPEVAARQHRLRNRLTHT